jgi:lipopolysaccharide biosynthesis glycosyltransferase
MQASPNTLLAAVRDFGLPCGHEGLLQLPGALQGHPDGARTTSSYGSTLSSCVSWSSSSSYFNAGLLLYNLKAWRQHGLLLHSALLQFGFRAEQSESGSNAEAAADRAACSAAAGGGGSCPPQHLGVLLHYSDQDVLNLLCCAGGGWVELDYCWNVQVSE